jgi:hypothetical protein
MSTFKDVLCALAIAIAYGIAGRMDYDDAIARDETQRSSKAPRKTGCPGGDLEAPAASAKDLEPAPFPDCLPLDQ